MSYFFDWKHEIKQEELNIASKLLRENKLVIFPTETVYGIGANALSTDACKSIFIAKGRPDNNPLIVHFADIDMLMQYVKTPSEIEMKLINRFMPGPFTLILEKKEGIPDAVNAGLSTIGVRIPSNKIAHQLMKASNIPIAAPSANVSGRPSGTCITDIKEELQEKVECIIDGGDCDLGLESTVVKVENNVPIILRPGFITQEDIESVTNNVNISKYILDTETSNLDKVESPGMIHKHYAPNKKCILVTGNPEEQMNKINQYIKENKNLLILAFEEDIVNLESNKEIIYLNIGSRKDKGKIANNLFTNLRKINHIKCDKVLIQSLEDKKGIGLAIYNRVIRACEGNAI